MQNMMMIVDETSIGTPNMPSRVMYIWPIICSMSYRCVQGAGRHAGNRRMPER